MSDRPEVSNQVSGTSDLVIQAHTITGGVSIQRAAVLPAPRELPAEVFGFAGRTEQLARLDALLDSPAMALTVVAGTAGVGKTALVVQWAHRARHRFPDGQLYVDLRGYGPDAPVEPAEALEAFLRALGVSGADIPFDVSERAARFRSLVDGRRVLVVLDNARAPEQVRPLLPGSSSCAVVVTSRATLSGLVARDGARVLDLDVLTVAEATDLLRSLIGAQVDDEELTALADRCARLPLALRIAAELVVSRPRTPVAELRAELADDSLDVLDAGGDPKTAVRAVFSWSYQHLDPHVAKAFRRLGRHPGRDLDLHAAVALTGDDLRTTRRTMDRLLQAHLVHETERGRFGMHDLLRVYAAELARQNGDDPLTALFDFYLQSAARAMDLIVPEERARRPRIEATGVVAPLTDRAAAEAWLEVERPTLMAVAKQAARGRLPGHAVLMSQVLWRFLDNRAYHDDTLALNVHALKAVRQLDDPALEASAENNLGTVYWQLRRYDDALHHLHRSLELARAAGRRGVEASALCNLGVVYRLVGDYDSALESLNLALSIAADRADHTMLARNGYHLGNVYERLRRYEEAADHLEAALRSAETSGNRTIEARVQCHLGAVCTELGRVTDAQHHLDRALDLAHDNSDRTIEARTLRNLGVLQQKTGRLHDALATLGRALGLAEAIRDTLLHVEILNSFAAAALAAGDTENAFAHHDLALLLATRIGDAYEQARAHLGLSEVLVELDDSEHARRHHRRALVLFEGLGLPPVR
ncbi:ATP-binding protein [Lentzea sp. NEAU-D13]|uniref:ATP-binding protein n=1 Tax=Lentzea alba TaxID=2714351 RepID=A0A7C9W741_9PSEU|nr:tetratricopeptide repeat protein [Lentzea alba]NGY65917.1 ATP-binding protein [Lentzea alba]